jgi:spermidine synthase
MVLPRLGGSPSVWNTCLVFYQTALMTGYIYAHLSLKWLGPRRQSLLHIALLCLACISLPIGVSQGWVPPSESNPIPWLLMLLTVCVGLPFFCISASAPLLQSWFSYCGGRSAKDPYFLYAASNLGSLAGLAAYPLLIEPRLALAVQSRWWAAGYALLTALFGICAAAVWIAGKRPAPDAVPESPAAGPKEATSATNDVAPGQGDVVAAGKVIDSLPSGFYEPVTRLRRLRWLALAIVPSALLMGVTAHLAVDIASVPLLWAIPLGLYLLSFIVVFARWPILKWLWLLRIFQAAALVGAVATIYLGGLETKDIMRVGALHLTAFFLTALVCHGEMAADRPASKHLTEYYLWMSAGGVVGGLLCALVAPLVFNSVLEYPLILIAACLLRASARSSRYERVWRWTDLALMLMQGCIFVFAACALWQGRLATMAEKWHSAPLKQLVTELTGPYAKMWWIVVGGILAFLLQRRRILFATSVVSLLLVCMICEEREDLVYSARSFFGVLRVELGHYGDGNQLVCHTLMNGSTMHGQQSRDPDDALDPWTYYCHSGPVGEMFAALEEREAYLHHGHIGVVGLGTGTVAAYAKPGQSLTYFEIDAAVKKIAQDPKCFTYLTNCHVEPQIRMGDARLTLTREPDGEFDVLLIDAFSSDAIPIHLLTREAIELYFQKLAPQGMLMVHLSNRHLHLVPVVAGTAEALHLVARLRDDDDETQDIGKTSSTWAVLTRAPEDLGRLKDDDNWELLKADPNLPLWTDDYSSIVSVMNWDWLPKWLKRAKAAE